MSGDSLLPLTQWAKILGIFPKFLPIASKVVNCSQDMATKKKFFFQKKNLFDYTFSDVSSRAESNWTTPDA